jgi:predicted RecA/RadA family phage recombinase
LTFWRKKMANNYVAKGIIWNLLADTDIAISSVVVIGALLGVALDAIADTESGPVQINGVFTVPKVSGAVIAQGESLTYDVSASAFDDNAATAAAGDITGAAAVAYESAGDGATTMQVMFTGVPGVVEAG